MGAGLVCFCGSQRGVRSDRYERGNVPVQRTSVYAAADFASPDKAHDAELAVPISNGIFADQEELASFADRFELA